MCKCVQSMYFLASFEPRNINMVTKRNIIILKIGEIFFSVRLNQMLKHHLPHIFFMSTPMYVKVIMAMSIY